MKNYMLFIGTLAICIGGFFLMDAFQMPVLHYFQKWPTVLLLLGIAYFVQGTVGKERHALFTSVLLCGLGLHFLFSPYVSIWPTHWGIYTLILGIALLTQKNESFKMAILLIAVSLLTIFYSDFQVWQDKLFKYASGLWPLILIGLGIFIIVKRPGK